MAGGRRDELEIRFDFVRSLNTGQKTAASANCSTAREMASPRHVGRMRQVRDLPRISALRRHFPTAARVAPLANVRGRSSLLAWRTDKVELAARRTIVPRAPRHGECAKETPRHRESLGFLRGSVPLWPMAPCLAGRVDFHHGLPGFTMK